jgi:hypothetical protein
MRVCHFPEFINEGDKAKLAGNVGHLFKSFNAVEGQMTSSRRGG